MRLYLRFISGVPLPSSVCEYIKSDELQSRKAYRKDVVLCRLQEGLSDLEVRLKLHEYVCVGMYEGERK